MITWLKYYYSLCFYKMLLKDISGDLHNVLYVKLGKYEL